MDSKKMFHSGISFQDFVNMDEDSYKEKTLEVFNSIDFSDEFVERIKSIDKNIKILICAEIWCPDCMINVPVVEKMKKMNNKIEISIVNREGNEDFFKKFSKDEKVKIPTFIFYDEEFNLLGTFIERPRIVKEVYRTGNQTNIIVTMRKYRKGEYIEETLKDILDVLKY
ncbi:thioredoxin family protein [Anaerosalibacter bizertensis]|uniref:Thioredoxin family protein n=1 Tax=Anaerosalibacter bizertensis TaxID=932217 RepID=A0A844FEM7_9FIRM|nr:thioredoxin family protein [Anaerosalibacter bizertensis]MSS42438.1 thioredoxin family protein [Anaerosalibacter bizertensis]HHV25855.1 DUF953 domain-containing protein [Tissierellia bacterium]